MRSSWAGGYPHSLLLGALLIACCQPIALGFDFQIRSVPETTGAVAADSVTIYSNLSNPTNTINDNNGAANVNGNTITRMTADDISPLAGFAGMSVYEFSCIVGNLANAPATVRVDLFIYDSSGPNGLPGAPLGVFPSQDITFGAHQSLKLILADAGPLFTLPSGKFWAGVAFDNRFGGIAVTAAQLNDLGMKYVNPPDIGASADYLFRTNSAGVSPQVNPAGGLFYNLGNPVANFGWEFVVPEPSIMGLAVISCGGLVLTIRRPAHRR
jgi:hypothetical protein